MMFQERKELTGEISVGQKWSVLEVFGGKNSQITRKNYKYVFWVAVRWKSDEDLSDAILLPVIILYKDVLAN